MAKLIGNSLDNAITGTAAADQIFGMGGSDTIAGIGGKDSIDGGSGADFMDGYTENDIYVVDSINDEIQENSGGMTIDNVWHDYGYDTVKSSVDWTLDVNTEKLILTGSKGLSGTGNDADNVIEGNDGANKLSGLNGHDSIFGSLGNDILSGGSGNDTLKGGSGYDSISGSDGDDTILTGGVEMDKLIDGGTGWDSISLSNAGVNVALGNAFADTVRNIEQINLNSMGANTLSLTAQDVYSFNVSTHKLYVSGDANDTLKIDNDNGWVNLGTEDIDQIGTAFHYSQYVVGQGQVDLYVDKDVSIVGALVKTTFNLTNQTSADKVGYFFDPHIAQTVTINLGGSNNVKYSDANFTNNTIDLSGFGKEDTLVIQQKDGILHYGTAQYGSRGYKYISEFNGKSKDIVSWYNANTSAHLISKSSLGVSNSIALTGLPTGLAESHFQFV